MATSIAVRRLVTAQGLQLRRALQPDPCAARACFHLASNGRGVVLLGRSSSMSISFRSIPKLLTSLNTRKIFNGRPKLIVAGSSAYARHYDYTGMSKRIDAEFSAVRGHAPSACFLQFVGLTLTTTFKNLSRISFHCFMD
ncbi:uncharacterized protein [Physcomitrium patens]|uniref:uncharacterized protein isoform X2 n=1 Tax=Physcomitrium patens TaxID=3218 RepID=UPI003CCDE6DB